MTQAQGAWMGSQSAVMVTCVSSILCTRAMHSGGGCIDYGWLAGSRVLMFLDESEERRTGIRTS